MIASFLTVLLLSFLSPVHADEGAVEVLPDITVLGDSAPRTTLDLIPTVSRLSGEKLERKKQSTLGETLSHEPGVSSSFFGPNASRPVIRGLGGERIRILSNGTGVLDASAASEDHAVAQDPLSVESIEIVRGPATLLYGSSAVGGVVNLVTNRIPEKKPEGFLGQAETKLTSVDSGAMAGVGFDYGNSSPWAFHFDGTSRSSSDYKVPGDARSYARRSSPDPKDALPDGLPEPNGVVPNSGNHTWSGSLGSSYLFDTGFAGLSVSHYNSDYGTVAEPNVHIQMQQDRVDFATGVKSEGWVQALKFKNSYSNYKHQEVDGETVGTTFKNQGDEARLELKHQKVGDFSGILGMQAAVFDFEALGDEAFLPKTHNQSVAGFVFEEAQYGAFKPSFGARVEGAGVTADANSQFVTSGQAKNFTATSASLGILYAVNPADAVVLNFAYTERAPNDQELFANGPHMATGAYEVGSVDLQKEQAGSAELSLRHKGEVTQGSLGLFVQDLKNFIALSPTTITHPAPDDPTNLLTEYDYLAVPARLYGAELEVKHQLPHLFERGVFEIEAKADVVHGRNRDTGQSLPRMTPPRETLGGSYKADHYTLDGEVQKVEKQNETALNETPTDAYTLVNFGVTAPVRWTDLTLNVFARVNNAFDVEARNHVSVLKDIAPLPGRNVTVGLQAAF